RGVRGLAGGSLAMLLLGCAAQQESPSNKPILSPSADEFSVMTYNLSQYTLADRDGDGQKNDLKPLDERNAVIDLIVRNNPDILAVEEIGTPGVFEEFRYAIAQKGLQYPHMEYLQRGKSEINLAVLSRFPIVDRQPHTDDIYSIGPAQVPVARGFVDVDIEIHPAYRLRLMVAHLKSKVFHSLGQTEMRRNEARLLNNHVRKALKENPGINLLVVGDMNDDPNSAALREITGSKQQYLKDLRPQDCDGDVWTFADTANDQYCRIDYMLATEGLSPEVVPEKTRVIRDTMTGKASDHRPVMAVFKSHELELSSTPATPIPPQKPAQEP
ncbi:MAG: endonuclease/exonuclease/phosphatase family protein, partial [Lentisphaerota bacterium]